MNLRCSNATISTSFIVISTSIILFLKFKYHFIVIYFCPQMYSIGWPEFSNTARKYNKDENLENHDSKF